MENHSDEDDEEDVEEENLGPLDVDLRGLLNPNDAVQSFRNIEGNGKILTTSKKQYISKVKLFGKWLAQNGFETMCDTQSFPICVNVTLDAIRQFFISYMTHSKGNRLGYSKSFNALNGMIHAIQWHFITMNCSTQRPDVVSQDGVDQVIYVDIKSVLIKFLSCLETKKADTLRGKALETSGGDQLGNRNELNGKKELTVEQYKFCAKLCLTQFNSHQLLLSIQHLAFLVLYWNIGLRPDSVSSMSYSMVSNYCSVCTYPVQCVHILYSVYMYCTMCTCIVQCVHVLYSVYMSCTVCTCIVQCVHVLYSM